MTADIVKNISNIFANNLTDNISTIIFSAIVLITGLILSKIARKSTSVFLEKLNVDQPILNYTVYSVYIICLSITLMTILSILGIPTTTILSILGVLGVSLGLAFKTTLENAGSGYILLFLKPFKIGDYIQFSDIEGTVSDIHIFSTLLTTFDNKTIIIPNSKITNQNIINYTKQDKRRIDIEFNLPYGTDIDFTNKLIQDILNNEKSVLKEPESLIAIRNFNDNGMEIVIRTWVKTDDYWNTFYALMSKIEKTFRENDIDMSVPQKIIYNNQNAKNNKK